MISLWKLSDIYKKWGDKNNIQPLESADAELLRNDLTVDQYAFLIQFCKVWDKTEKKEREKSDEK
tara:strand:+ start:92 stop:286 length:195 start_codon:yes stop_codon:yes gene_type:complete